MQPAPGCHPIYSQHHAAKRPAAIAAGIVKMMTSAHPPGSLGFYICILHVHVQCFMRRDAVSFHDVEFVKSHFDIDNKTAVCVCRCWDSGALSSDCNVSQRRKQAKGFGFADDLTKYAHVKGCFARARACACICGMYVACNVCAETRVRSRASKTWSPWHASSN